jgi:DNA-binding transcriptional LysR family regulator
MAKAVNWEARIGRRVRLRDLHVLFAVVQSGSMAKAAAQLGITQSAISQMIADLEHALGVRLLDRSPRGVEPTVYGNALLKYGKAAFDDLRQGIQEIEFLADPGVGEIRIGAPESVSAAILPAIIRRFSQQYPRALLDVDTTAVTTAVPKLRDRSLDLVMVLGAISPEDIHLASDLKVEVLFNDELVVAADAHSQWARRRKIDLVELSDAPWILAPSGFSNVLLAEAFRARGQDMPKISLKTFSIHIRANLIAGSSFVTTLPKSVLNYYAHRLPLKALPVALPARPWPLLLVTLKNRSVSPVVERFIKCAREVTKSIAESAPARKKS